MVELNSKEEKKQFYRMVCTLVLPMALQNLINVGVQSADVIMLGKVGETALSASSLAGQVMFIMSLIFFGLTSGAAVLTAQYWGKRDTRTIEKVLGMAMRIAILVGILFTVAVYTVPYPIMKIFTSEPEVIEAGVSYLKIVGISYIFTAITMVYLNLMRSVERVIISTVVYSISLVVNIVLNSIFIFGLLGCPALGIRGAAIGTLVARVTEFAIVMWYAKFKNKEVRFRIKDLFVKDKKLQKDFLVFAMPVLINELLWGTGTSMLTAVIGHLGSSMVAANSVAQVVRQLAMVISFGLSNATAIVIGKAIGEGKENFARLYSKRFIKLAVIVGAAGGALILMISPFVQANMNLSDQAKSYLSVMMFVMAYFALAQSYNCTMIVGIFRAGGDTKFGLYIDVGMLWGFCLVVGSIAAFWLKFPPLVIYMILMSDELLKIPFSTWRYRTGKWVRNITR